MSLSLIFIEIWVDSNALLKILLGQKQQTHKQQEDIKTIYLVLPHLNSKVEEFGFRNCQWYW